MDDDPAPSPKPASDKGGLPPAVLRRVLAHINAHLTERIELSDLAALAGLSRHHFGAAFKQSIGLAPHHYILERRLERARDLLQEQGRSIASIAAAAGFSSQSHLTVRFARWAGTTPGRYRSSLK